jgi:hypothetical protein
LDWISSTIGVDNFTTWLMYQPPSVNKAGTIWVPIMSATWTAQASASGGPSNWGNVTGAYTPPSPAATTTYPAWSVVISGQQCMP